MNRYAWYTIWLAVWAVLAFVCLGVGAAFFSNEQTFLGVMWTTYATGAACFAVVAWGARRKFRG